MGYRVLASSLGLGFGLASMSPPCYLMRPGAAPRDSLSRGHLPRVNAVYHRANRVRFQNGGYYYVGITDGDAAASKQSDLCHLLPFRSLLRLLLTKTSANMSAPSDEKGLGADVETQKGHQAQIEDVYDSDEKTRIANQKADAIDAENAEHELGVIAAIRGYPMAALWAFIISCTIVSWKSLSKL